MPDFVIPRYILAFDTAMGGCSAAVFDAQTGQAVSDSRAMTRGQSEELVPMVQGVVRQAGIDFPQIGLVVTTIGPGAFTGLRIGISAARSFGLALGAPVAGLRTTDVIAHACAEKSHDINRLLVVLETKRTDFYVQEGLAEPGVLAADELRAKYQDITLTFCGDGVLRLQSELGAAWPQGWSVAAGFDLPDPVMMARMALEDAKAGHLRPAEPLYLRDADVSVSNKPARVIAGES